MHRSHPKDAHFTSGVDTRRPLRQPSPAPGRGSCSRSDAATRSTAECVSTRLASHLAAAGHVPARAPMQVSPHGRVVPSSSPTSATGPSALPVGAADGPACRAKEGRYGLGSDPRGMARAGLGLPAAESWGVTQAGASQWIAVSFPNVRCEGLEGCAWSFRTPEAQRANTSERAWLAQATAGAGPPDGAWSSELRLITGSRTSSKPV